MLARTSNPDAGSVPARPAPGSGSVAQAVVDTVRGWNTPDWVVGDPLPDIAAVRDLAGRWGRPPARSASSSAPRCRELDVDLDGLGGPVLAPGLGAQGGSWPTCAGCSAPDRAVVPTVSRDVLGAGPDAAALRAAADRWTAELSRLRRGAARRRSGAPDGARAVTER